MTSKYRAVIWAWGFAGWTSIAAAQTTDSSGEVEAEPMATTAEEPVEDPAADVAVAGGVPAAAAPVSGPTVWIVPKKEDRSRGVIKLARHENSTAQQAGEAILITTTYTEICSAPCGVPVDVSERPIFYFVRDGRPISKAFRLTDVEGEVTVRVRPHKTGMMVGGILFTSFLLLPIGIPMIVAANSKLWIAEGTPEQHSEWVKLPKAKF